MGVLQGLVLLTTTYCNIQRQRHHAKTSHILSPVASRCHPTERESTHPPGHPEPEMLASDTSFKVQLPTAGSGISEKFELDTSS